MSDNGVGRKSDTDSPSLEKVPECWNQEERMSALFSPFRSRSANPQDWTSKYKFWHDLIHEWLRHNVRCSFSIVDLNEAFKRRGCAPLCLATVIEELLRNNEIIKETDFFKQQLSESWMAWSIDMFVRKPFSWSFSKMRDYMIGPDAPDAQTRYIYLCMVRELGDIILSIDVRKGSALYPISEIVELCKSKTGKPISESTVTLVLEWLRCRRKVAFARSHSNPNGELLVKISTQTVSEITEVDKGMYKLMRQENKLVQEIELIEREKLDIVNEAKSYLRKEMHQVAKTHLRRKMELERTIEKRAQALANLRTLINNIEEAHSNSAVLSAYKTGSDMLKKMGRDGLTEYAVVDVMNDINEVLEENKDVNTVLSETLNNSDSDAELEKELAELLSEDNANTSSVANPEIDSEIEKLEQRLSELRTEGFTSPSRNVTALPSVPSRGKDTLEKPECL